MNLVRRILACAVVVFLAPVGVHAGDVRDVGREKGEKLESAIVKVRCVVNSHQKGRNGATREREFKTETAACFVSADGLVLAQLDRVDVTAGWRRRIGEKAASESGYDATIKNVLIILDDRSEVPATIVLRDIDHNMAIVRPVDSPKQPYNFINLEEASSVPSIMEEVITLGRWDRLGRVVPWACVGSVTATMEKPRRAYIPAGDLASLHSALPVFSGDGRLTGILATWIKEGSADAASGEGPSSMTVIYPPTEILPIIKQAREMGTGTTATAGS